MKRGYIYLSSYAGWYAVSDEAYYTQSQVVESLDLVSGEAQVVRSLDLLDRIDELNSSASDLNRDRIKSRMDGGGELQVPPVRLPRAAH
jgi:hypothetical protein